MPRAATPATDLSPADFRSQLRDLGFAFIGGTADVCIDIRPQHRTAPHCPHVKVIRGLRRKIQYRATLQACRLALATLERSRAEADARSEREQTIAATLAPQVLPRARSTLAGPDEIQQLADDCLTLKAGAGQVLFKDLMSLGWTRRQIFARAEAARSLADARENGVMA